MTSHILFFLIVAFMVSGCNSTMKSSKLPETLAEGYVTASYVPLDGLPIFSSHDARSCNTNAKSEQSNTKAWKDLLDSLPDQTIRMTVGQYTNSGTISFGPISAGMKGTQYKVVLDYINNDAINVPLLIARTQDATKSETSSVFSDVKPGTNFIVSRIEDNNEKSLYLGGGNVVNVTVYVGIGLRITAHITANKAGVDLSSLSALSAGAETDAISGTLTVQTIGITGPSVSASLPMPTDLTEESIQSSILALGGIKSSIYDTENTTKTARVVGMYIPVGGNQILVENIRNALAKTPIVWKRACKLN